MCGRYTLRTRAEILAEIFGVSELPDYQLRFNIAPTQDVLALRLNDEGKKEVSLFRWGLILSWAKDVKIGNSMINARADTVRTKPSFRSAFKKRRCLILADGFYEWQAQGTKKQPMLMSRGDSQPFAFAGLWERWEKDAQVIRSCTIITTDANEFMKPVHDRMPTILPPTDYDRWLSCEPDEAETLLSDATTEGLKMIPVSTLVNSPRNDKPECVEPI